MRNRNVLNRTAWRSSPERRDDPNYVRAMMNKYIRVTRSPALGATLTAATMFLLGIPYSAQAQDWRVEPIISLGGEFDDNATLDIRTDQEVELTGYLLELRADVDYSSPTTSFFVQPRVLLRNYPDDADFDSDDLFLRSDYNYSGRFNTFGFRLNFDRQSVRTGERADSDLEVEDPEDIPQNDSARLFRFGTRDYWWISPYWGYRISDTSSIGLDLNLIEASYDQELEGLLDDYTDSRLNVEYRRALSGVTTGVMTLTGRRYNADGSENDIDGVGFLVGVDRRLSEKVRLIAMAGLEDTDTTGPNTDPEVVGRISLIRNLEIINMFAQYQRSLVASGARSLSIRDSISFNFKRRLSEKISAGVGIRAYQSRGLNEVVSIDDRNYVQLQSSFTWYVTSYFAIEAQYRYTVLDRSDVFGERSNSNRINLWFVYQPRTVPKI